MPTEPKFEAWSWSRWETYDNCPLQAKMKFLVKGKPFVASPAMERGDRIHKGVAAYIEGKVDAPPVEVTLPFQLKLLAECRAAEDKVVEQQWAFNRQWGATGWFAKSSAPSGAAWLRTIVDYAVAYEDNAVEIIDWKSGKVYGHNVDQLELFALSAMRYFRPATKVLTRLVYFDAHTEITDEFNAADQDKLIAKWEDKVRPMFEDTTFLPRPGNHCYRCDFAKSKGGACRFG